MRWRHEKKKDMEENETLDSDDLQQNEDERGSIQPLLKANSEAAERSSSRTAASVLHCYGDRDLMRGGQMELRAGTAGPFSPGLAALPSFSNHVAFCEAGTSSCRWNLEGTGPDLTEWTLAVAVCAALAGVFKKH